MRSRGLDVDGVQRLTSGHEESVSPRPAETDVRAGLGKANHTDALAVGCDHLDSRPCASPDVSVHIAADAVSGGRCTGSGNVELNESFAVATCLAVHIPGLDVARHAGVG